jgi:hypothetical protein
VRERAVQPRCFARDDRADFGFVIGIGPRVQEHDRDRLDVVGVELLCDAGCVLAIEHGDDFAVGVEAFDDLERVVAWNVGHGPLEEDVVGFGTAAAADLVDVAHPFGHDERRACARSLDRGVDRDGRTVNKRLGSGQRQTALRQCLTNADGEVVRGRRTLGLMNFTGCEIECNQVGERAADVERENE